MKNFINHLLKYIFAITGVISFMNVLFTVLLDGFTNEAFAWLSSGIMALTTQYFFNLSSKEEE